VFAALALEYHAREPSNDPESALCYDNFEGTRSKLLLFLCLLALVLGLGLNIMAMYRFWKQTSFSLISVQFFVLF